MGRADAFPIVVLKPQATIRCIFPEDTSLPARILQTPCQNVQTRSRNVETQRADVETCSRNGEYRTCKPQKKTGCTQNTFRSELISCTDLEPIAAL